MAAIPHIIKLLVIGDSGVGKSNLILRYVKNIFSEETEPTIGVEFFSTKFEVNKKEIQVQIWDTAGQERFRSFTSQYYRGAKGVMICYDVGKKGSFSNCQYWLAEVKQNFPDLVGICVSLVGTKSDTDRVVSLAEAQRFARANELDFIETSALTAENVVTAFHSLCSNVVAKETKASVEVQRSTVVRYKRALSAKKATRSGKDDRMLMREVMGLSGSNAAALHSHGQLNVTQEEKEDIKCCS